MTQALYRKWRPLLWSEVVGQDHVVTTLRNAIKNQRVGHAFLFAGPRGTGKTTTARLLAKAVNCQNPDPANRPCNECEYCRSVNEGRFLDLIEIDAASNTSVDDVRDLRDKINFSPSQGKYKVYIIDEVHMLSTAAFNALLKTLEEPPAHAIFILATTEIHKIPATVLSRCQRHEFRRIPLGEMTKHLTLKAQQEDLAVDADAITLIARQSTGCLRDAISLLDQLSATGERVTLEMAQGVLGTATNQTVIELTRAIISRDAASGITCIQQALDSGSDPRQFARQIVEYLRSLLLIRLKNAEQIDATAETRTLMREQADAFEERRLVETIRLFNQAASEGRAGWHPGLQLELALAEAMEKGLAPVPEAYPQSAPQIAPAPQMARVAPPPEANPTPPPQAAAPARAQSVEELVQSVQRGYPAAAQPPAPTPEAAAKSGLTQGMVQQNWARIRQLVKQKRLSTEALLNSVKSFTVKEGVLVLGFQTPVLKEKMDAEENMLLVQQVLRQVLSLEVPIRSVVLTSKGGSNPGDLDVEGDGLINEAINLGGEIVYKQEGKF